MPPINVVGTVEHSTKDLKDIEELAKTKLQTWSKELIPVGRHLATGVASNIAALKILGGSEYKQAVGASITSSVVSTVLEKQFKITHPVPKVIVGTASYTGAFMLGGTQAPLQDIIVMGVVTNILSELICNYM